MKVNKRKKGKSRLGGESSVGNLQWFTWGLRPRNDSKAGEKKMVGKAFSRHSKKNPGGGGKHVKIWRHKTVEGMLLSPQSPRRA